MDFISLGWRAGDNAVAPLSALCHPHHGPVVKELTEMAKSPQWCTQIADGTGIKITDQGEPKFTGRTSPAVCRRLLEMAENVGLDLITATKLVKSIPYDRIVSRAAYLVIEHDLSSQGSPITFDQGSPLTVGPPQLLPTEVSNPNIFPAGDLMPARLMVNDGHLAIVLPVMRASGPFSQEPMFEKMALQLLIEEIIRRLDPMRNPSAELLLWSVLTLTMATKQLS